MEESQSNMDCGCNPPCESCANGDHDNCTTGKCTWKTQEDGSDPA